MPRTHFTPHLQRLTVCHSKALDRLAVTPAMKGTFLLLLIYLPQVLICHGARFSASLNSAEDIRSLNTLLVVFALCVQHTEAVRRALSAGGTFRRASSTHQINR